jgi:hypothetical protein
MTATVNAPDIYEIQASCWRAENMVRRVCQRLATATTKSGVMYVMLRPSNQESVQKSVESPSPRMKKVEALKKVVVTRSSFTSIAPQAWAGSERRSHN